VTARRRIAGALVAGTLLLGAGACARDQDPGLVPSASTVEGATTPHQLLQDCPPGGPDATTPAAGCVDADGNVLRP
jgi:hypothetical protein